MQNMNAIRQHVVELARGAGEIIMDHYGKRHNIDYKAKHDVVTEADKAAEAYIVPALAAAYPTHHIVGEEGGSTGAPFEESEYRWYIDPIDGTTNYAAHIPHFCTSIALADADNQPILGVIYDPNRDELFVAERGIGATMNDEPIAVSTVSDLDNAVVGTGFPYDRHSNLENNYAQFEYFASRVRGIRRFGSAALDISWVACGRLDAYWEWRLSRWDFFAGWLMVTEAGGVVSDFSGGTGDLLNSGRQILVTSNNINTPMLDGMASILHPTA
ncbi:MAG: inositol monophosphatase family protein [Chloroflexota bacterium]